MEKKSYNTIDEALVDYLRASRKQVKLKRGVKYWAASSLGQCLRKQYFTREMREPTNMPESKYLFGAKNGTAIHRWMQTTFKKLGILVKAEGTLVSRKYKYRGHYDALIKLKSGLSLLDIKTQGSHAWYNRKHRWKDQVPDYHLRQLGSYFLFLRKKYPKLKDARLYYYNRDTGEREEFKVTFAEKYLQGILNELNTLNYYWDNKIIPPPIKPKDRWKCRFCEFRGYCKDINLPAKYRTQTKTKEFKSSAFLKTGRSGVKVKKNK